MTDEQLRFVEHMRNFERRANVRAAHAQMDMDRAAGYANGMRDDEFDRLARTDWTEAESDIRVLIRATRLLLGIPTCCHGIEATCRIRENGIDELRYACDECVTHVMNSWRGGRMIALAIVPLDA